MSLVKEVIQEKRREEGFRFFGIPIGGPGCLFRRYPKTFITLTIVYIIAVPFTSYQSALMMIRMADLITSKARAGPMPYEPVAVVNDDRDFGYKADDILSITEPRKGHESFGERKGLGPIYGPKLAARGHKSDKAARAVLPDKKPWTRKGPIKIIGIKLPPKQDGSHMKQNQNISP